MKKLFPFLFLLLSCEREAPRDLSSLTGDWQFNERSYTENGVITFKQDGERLTGKVVFNYDDYISSYLVGTVRGDSVKFDVYITILLNGYKYTQSFAGVLTYESNYMYSNSMAGTVVQKEAGLRDKVWDFKAYKIIEK